MRFLESFLLFTIAFSLFSLFLDRNRRPKWVHLCPTLSLVVLAAHILIEGSRWQMFPAYALTVLLFLFTLGNVRYCHGSSRDLRTRSRAWPRRVGASLGTLPLVVSVLIPLAFPVFRLPSPTGEHGVGTVYDYLVDTSRREYTTSDTTDFCEMSLRIWYPADVTEGVVPERYWDDASTRSAIITGFWGDLPPFLFSHFGLTETHSYRGAGVARERERYPVLVFNHGAVGVPSLHTALMEDIASHGYVVCTIGHADYAPFLVKPDGGIRLLDPDNADYLSRMRENDDGEVRAVVRDLMASSDPEEQKLLLGQFLELNPCHQRSVRRWGRDISFVIDELETMDRGPGMLAGRLDLDRLGVFGISFGGAASTHACVYDSRIKAAASIDCIQFGDLLDSGAPQPMMFMSSDQYEGKDDLFLETRVAPTYVVQVKGTVHANFSDMSLWGGVLKMQMLGTIDGRRCQEIQNVCIRAFFDRYLKGEELECLSEACAEYPEVEMRSARDLSCPDDLSSDNGLPPSSASS
jgi:hypothetical protein